jgi:hypothetical protein
MCLFQYLLAVGTTYYVNTCISVLIRTKCMQIFLQVYETHLNKQERNMLHSSLRERVVCREVTPLLGHVKTKGGMTWSGGT